MNNSMINPINVEEIMKEIRSEIAEKRSKGIYPKESIIPSNSLNYLDNANDTVSYLEELKKHSFIRHDILKPSSRPIFGTAITFFKKIIRKATAWYFLSITEQINANNNYVVKILENIIKEIPYLSSENKTKLLDDNYQLFEDLYRGPQDDIKERQKYAIKYFKNKKDVLDIGCGRGEMLDLLKENNIKSQGIDSNSKMVSICYQKGHDVTQANALDFLDNIPNNRLGGIFIGQVIEHLNINYLIDLIQTSFEKIKIDSYIVIEAPNPLSITVSASNFYRDITHNKIIHPDALRFLLEAAGFRDIKVDFMSEFPKNEILDFINGHDNEINKLLNQNFEKINNKLFGYQDFIITAKKPN